MSEQMRNDMHAVAAELQAGMEVQPEPWSSEEAFSLLQRLVPALKAGMGMAECLEALQEEAGDGPQRARFHRLGIQICRGESLATCLEQRQAPAVMVAFVQAGEAEGGLDRALSMLMDYLEEEKRLRQTPGDPQWVTPADLSLWCRLLGSLLTLGRPILAALEVVAEQTDAPALREATLCVRVHLRAGGTLREALDPYPFFPPLLRRMLIVAGDREGHIDTVLLDLADHPESYQTLGPGYPAKRPASLPHEQERAAEIEAEVTRNAGIRPLSGPDIDIPGEDTPILRIVNSIIQQAFQEGATDIHIEPTPEDLRVRFRIDGALREIMSLPQYAHPPLVSRFKIMAALDITERNTPQRGRIGIRHQDQDYGLRVSTFPFAPGEGLVIRVLRTRDALDLCHFSEIGLSEEDQARCEGILRSPCGLVVVTGPQGSGRSTTLFAASTRPRPSLKKCSG